MASIIKKRVREREQNNIRKGLPLGNHHEQLVTISFSSFKGFRV